MPVHRDLLTQAPNGVLSLEQIAAVGLSGIMAYQAMDELCSKLPKGSKLIILNAHEGVGAIALQLSLALRPAADLWVVAHFPPDFADGNEILRQLGANETLSGEVLAALQSLRESTYDAVLDTIGGKRIYDTARQVLHEDGMFGRRCRLVYVACRSSVAFAVTTVGDALAPPTQGGHWKKSLKALFKPRSDVQKVSTDDANGSSTADTSSQRITYWFPSPEEHSPRVALDRLREICEQGQLRPVVKRVYKFEDGANAFKGQAEQSVIMLLNQET